MILAGLVDGTILNCDLQVKYELQPKFEKNGKKYKAINYVADFVITYANGEMVVVDTKGIADATAKLKKKMMDYKYPDLNYIWVGYCKKYGGWLEYGQLEKLRKENKNLKGKAND